MANYWLNSDGLLVKFGATEGASQGITGIGWCNEYEDQVDGGLHVTEVTLNTMTAIPASAASGAGIVDDTVTIPNGARIERVKVICFTAATSGGSATLNIGLIDQDRTTEIDFDGLVAALAKTAYDAAGETNDIVVGSTGAGALIGTTLTNTGYISVDYDTAVFTAGIVKVRVYWSVPYSTTSP